MSVLVVFSGDSLGLLTISGELSSGVVVLSVFGSISRSGGVVSSLGTSLVVFLGLLFSLGINLSSGSLLFNLGAFVIGIVLKGSKNVLGSHLIVKLINN